MRRITKIFMLCLILVFSLGQISFAQQNGDKKETASSRGAVVNINTATAADLERLPGIGPSLAKRILDFRQKNGGFKSPTDLIAVQGIGEKKFEQLKNLVTVK